MKEPAHTKVLVEDAGARRVDIWADCATEENLAMIKGVSRVFKEQEKSHYEVEIDPRYDKQAVMDLIEHTVWMIARGEAPGHPRRKPVVSTSAMPPEPEAPKPFRLGKGARCVPLLCRLGLWHRWSKWSAPGIAKHYSFNICDDKYIASDVCVQDKQCRCCGLIKVRVAR